MSAQPGEAVSPYLAIATASDGARCVLSLHGELDVYNEGVLRRAIRTVLDEQDPTILIVDLSELSFTDCAGLSAMIWAHVRLAERGHDLVITGAQPIVRRLLQVTGLDRHLNVTPPAAPTGQREAGQGKEGSPVAEAER